MEIYKFNTDGVEDQLHEILSSINVLHYAINGLNEIDNIDPDTVNSFDSVIADANIKLHRLVKSMKPLSDSELMAVEELAG
ncbi:MAG: hypothetical protein GY754_41350 [bacterium]|nr:hypothetical protein [bacterium]